MKYNIDLKQEWKINKVQCCCCKIGNKLTKKMITKKKINNKIVYKGWKCKVCNELNIIKDYNIYDDKFKKGKILYLKELMKVEMINTNPFSKDSYSEILINIKYVKVDKTPLLYENKVTCIAFGDFKHRIKHWLPFIKEKKIKEELYSYINIEKSKLSQFK